jgi:hypothetical protein
METLRPHFGLLTPVASASRALSKCLGNPPEPPFRSVSALTPYCFSFLSYLEPEEDATHRPSFCLDVRESWLASLLLRCFVLLYNDWLSGYSVEKPTNQSPSCPGLLHPQSACHLGLVLHSRLGPTSALLWPLSRPTWSASQWKGSCLASMDCSTRYPLRRSPQALVSFHHATECKPCFRCRIRSNCYRLTGAACRLQPP